jgi:hypothetical protein
VSTRLRTLVLFAAVAVLATALIACGGGDDGGGGGGGSDEDAQAVVDRATLQGVESGDLDLSLGIKVEGDEGGDLDISLSGPFQSEGKEQLPQLDMTAQATGSVGDEDIDFDGGLVLLPNKAYVNYEGTEYEVDPTTFSFVESAIQEQGGAAGGSGEVTPCQKAVGKLDIGDFVDNVSSEGDADVDGTSTTKVSGEVDTSGAVDLLVELGKDPACRAQLNAAGPIPSQAELEEGKEDVQNAVKDGQVELYVGEDDIVRRVVAELTIEPGGNASEAVGLELDMTLTGVNEEQTISAPSGAKPLSDLFLELGVNPIELLGALNGEGVGSLLESFGGGAGKGSGSGSDRQGYLKCLQTVQSAADLQRCAGLK